VRSAALAAGLVMVLLAGTLAVGSAGTGAGRPVSPAGPSAPPGTVVTGNVTDAVLHTPLVGARIVADTGPNTTTASNGRFTFRLPDGLSTLTVSHAGFHRGTTQVNVQAGQGVPPANVALQPFLFNLGGSVANRSSGAPVGGALVTIAGTPSLSTDRSGNFVTQLRNGTYTATVSASGYQTANWAFRVNGGPVSLTVLLNSSAGSGNGGPPPGGGGSGSILDPSLSVTDALYTILVAVAIGVAGTLAVFVWRSRVRRAAAAESLAAIAVSPPVNDPTSVGSRSELRRSRQRRR
jgi:hypothetical protein